MSILTKYLVPCLTEGFNVTTDYKTSFPTECPNNNTHIIDVSGISVLHTLAAKIVTINENSTVPDGGNYRADQFELSVIGGTGTVNTYDITYPYNVSAYAVIFMPMIDNMGDTFQVVAYPDTVIGLITAALSTLDTELFLPSIVGLSKGFQLSVTDGINTDNLGEIINIDVINNKVIFSNPVVNPFIIGSTVSFTVPRIKNGKFVNTQNWILGLSRIGSSGLMANAIVRLAYTNLTGTAKTLNFIVELSY